MGRQRIAVMPTLTVEDTEVARTVKLMDNFPQAFPDVAKILEVKGNDLAIIHRPQRGNSPENTYFLATGERHRL